MQKKYVKCSFFRVLGLLALSFWLVKPNQILSETTESSITPVKILAVNELLEEEFDTFLARLDATSRAQLSFQVQGEIKELKVRMGQRVKKGEVLATLDSQDLRLALNASNAEYLLIKAQWERAKNLYKRQLMSVDDYDKLETMHRTALVKYENAKTDLSYTKILAPFDGVVSFTYVKPYQFVQSKQQILNIINNEKLDVLVTLPVSYVEDIGLASLENLDIWVVVDNEPDNRIKGVFKEISTKPNEDTNSYEAIVSIKRPKNKNLLTGMSGVIQIAKKNFSQEIYLPKTAWISQNGDQGQVWIMNPKTNRVTKTTLTLNAKGAVKSGLDTDDLVVIAGVERLVEDQEVKAWIREEGI